MFHQTLYHIDGILNNKSLKVVIKRSPTIDEEYFIFKPTDKYINDTSYHTVYDIVNVNIDEFISIAFNYGINLKIKTKSESLR